MTRHVATGDSMGCPVDDPLAARLRTAIKGGDLNLLPHEKMKAAADRSVDLDWRRLATEDTPEVLLTIKRLCYLAETLDYVGNWADAEKPVGGGQLVYSYLIGHHWKAGPHNRKLLREKVRYTGLWARQSLYRSSVSHEKAQVLFERLIRLVERDLVAPDFPCHRTLAQLKYYLGRTLRHRHLMRAADGRFIESVRHYAQFVEQARASMSVSAEDLDEAQYKMAVCEGLGRGWLACEEGRLAEAAALVESARVRIPERDRLNLAVLDLLDGSIALRTRTDPTALEDAETMLAKALQTFAGPGSSHPLYHARATYEFALAAFLRGHSEDALQRVEMFLALEAEHSIPGRTGWTMAGRNLRARILGRGRDPDNAMREATELVRIANEPGFNRQRRVPYLLTLAELQMAIAEWDEAIFHLESAAKAIDRAPDGDDARATQLWAVTQLLLANCYSRVDDHDRAAMALTLGERAAAKVEGGRVPSLREQVREVVLSDERPFVIPLNTMDVHKDTWMPKFERSLCLRARRIILDRGGWDHKADLFQEVNEMTGISLERVRIHLATHRRRDS